MGWLKTWREHRAELEQARREHERIERIGRRREVKAQRAESQLKNNQFAERWRAALGGDIP